MMMKQSPRIPAVLSIVVVGSVRICRFKQIECNSRPSATTRFSHGGLTLQLAATEPLKTSNPLDHGSPPLPQHNPSPIPFDKPSPFTLAINHQIRHPCFDALHLCHHTQRNN